MKNNNTYDWGQYFDATRDAAPFQLMNYALNYCSNGNLYALDLGAGALRNTRYLLSWSYQVDAVDSSPLFAAEAARINNPNLHAYTTTFDNFNYPIARYGFIVARNALTFNPPETLMEVLQKIKNSLAPGGVFCANFSGKNDEWASHTDKSFVTQDELKNIFSDMKIVKCEEWERDTNMAIGGTKHSDIIDFIAQKPF